MKPSLPFKPALFAALLMGGAWADGNQEPVAPPAPAAAAPQQTYDALYSDILQSLPAGQRAQVDSAQGAKDKQEKDKPDPEAAKAAAEAKRAKVLSELPPEVKSRVDKAIKELDKRRTEKAAELKELRP